MDDPVLRDAAEADLPRILALNEGEERHTSPLDLEQLRFLHSISAYHRVISIDGTAAAFLLALREHAPYQNDNYAWFSSRCPEFIYIDRVVVDARQQGKRLGSRLYHDLFSFARRQDVPTVACEFNIVPPNEPSRLFHARFGFEEVGTQWLAGGTKQVSLQTATL
ncbi:MAG: GNAT family N-acetyltransferase [Elusimicrobia bacterium RIFOXYD12_FULL_66_9]|nr:MAG: GNAT family N-acetyltransferase [Elusimicrobia bacterium RIFOXYD12_FULL_66_9]